MRRFYLIIVLSLLKSFPSLSQNGEVYDQLSMFSNILDSERKFAVYLPPDYATSKRSYPVLYLLHGSGDDQTGWIQYGEVLSITDNAIKKGLATPMIIIMPDAKTGTQGYFNIPDWRYEDFFFKELIPYVEKTYRIKGEKRFRAIAGLSLGGGGSFVYALHHPEMFSSACPLSAYVGELSLEAFKASFRASFLEKYPKEEIENYYRENSVMALIENKSVENLRSIRWYIDCGDDDFLYEGNSLVHIALKKKEIAHEYRVRDGSHTWTYWRSSLPSVLEFISQSFHQY